MKGIIGRKLGMTTIYKDGKAFGVTVIKAGPCVVSQKKLEKNDEYNAIQIAFEELTEQRAKKILKKPLLKKYESAGIKPHRIIKEIRTEDVDKYNVGDVLKVDIFSEGEKVDVVGTSKGRGFSGAMKRWNFGGGEASHGAKFHRELGSIGNSSQPSKIWKGKKMPGQYGNKRKTVQNLQVLKVDAEKNIIAVYGGVPGARGSLLLVRSQKKLRK